MSALGFVRIFNSLKKKWFLLAFIVCMSLIVISIVLNANEVGYEELVYFKSPLKHLVPSSAIFNLLNNIKSRPTPSPISLTAPNCNSSLSSLIDTLLETDSLTGSQFIQYLMWPNRSSCQLTQDFGGSMLKSPSALDGQKAICLDRAMAPKAGECLVYSFGIDDEWSFDETMERYGCQVFSFDPSMQMKPHQHSSAVHFYDWGLGHQNDNGTNFLNGWKMRTLSTIYRELSSTLGRHPVNQVIDYLKIDIESAEWRVLPNIIESGMLSKVRQLGIEIHLANDETVNEYSKLALLLRTIEKMGMVRFDSKYNPWFVGNFPKLNNLWASRGYELAWYNSHLRRL